MLSVAKKGWEKANREQKYLMIGYKKKDFNKEVKWFKSKTTKFLNNQAKIRKVCT